MFKFWTWKGRIREEEVDNLKIIKLIKNYNHYRAVFDYIPKITYEKIGLDYIGSYVDSDGAVVLSQFLKYAKHGDAFGGREIPLPMKDGSIKTIKVYWFDSGCCEEHGEFVDIGAGKIEELQRCYVYFGLNINKQKFNEMVEDYLKMDKVYSHGEVEDWCKLQYEWHNVIVNGKQIPYMMNEYGDMVEKETKKIVFARYNLLKKVNGKYKTYTYFKFKYKDDDGRLIKIDANYLEVLRATLPFTEKEIKKKCKISSIEEE